MKPFRKPLAAGAAIGMMTMVCAVAMGQTMVDLRSQARNVDFSQAITTRPFAVGTNLPPLCAVGQTFFRSDALPGQNLMICTATNIWSPVSAAGVINPASGSGLTMQWDIDGSSTLDTDKTILPTQNGDNVYTGSNDFSRATSLQVAVSVTKPNAASCDSAGKVGRIVLRKSDTASQASVLYLCQATAAGTFGWKASTYGHGTGRPATCDAGELFFDLGAPVGQQWLGCVSANTWTVLGGPGGSSLPAQTANAGKLLATNGTAPGWRTLGGFVDTGSNMISDGTMFAELDTNNVWTGNQRYPASAVQVLTSASARIRCDRRTVAVTSAGALMLTSGPTIADGMDGQVCVIVNTGSNDITIQDQDTLPLSNLQLAAAKVVVAPKSMLTLTFNAAIGDWVQETSTTALADPSAARLTSDNNWTGRQYYPPSAVQNLTDSASTILANAATVQISSAAPQTLCNPGAATISSGMNGQDLVIMNVGSEAITMSSQETCPASNLRLASSTITVRGKSSLQLRFNSSVGAWVQMGVPASAATMALRDTSVPGVVVRTDSVGTTVARTITGANGITVGNGDGVAAAPEISMPGVVKGDLIVHDGGQNRALRVGADGQVLQSDSSQAAGMRWAAKSPVTSEGDLYTRDTAGDQRLPAGSNGSALVADSGAATGLKWVPGVYQLAAVAPGTSFSTTPNAQVWSYTIPANTLAVGDEVRCRYLYTKTGTNSVVRHRLLWGGTPMVMYWATGNVADAGEVMEVSLTVTGTTSQVGHVASNLRLPGNTLANGGAVLAYGANIANDITVSIEGWLLSGLDTAKLAHARCTVFKGQ